MSGRDDFYQPPSGPPGHHLGSNNPYQQSETEQNAWQSQPSSSPTGQREQSYQSYAPPPGPPPPQQNAWQDAPPGHLPQQHSQPQQYQPQGYQPQQPQSSQFATQESGFAPGLPDRNSGPNRSATFKESDFVPADERGEQREALEHFEMSKGSESTEDRDIATLQQEFPGVDGSLVAALYGDSKSLSGTREMLREVAGG